MKGDLQSTQFKVTPVGKSDYALDFKTDIVAGGNAGFNIDEIIYSFKVMTVTCEPSHECDDCLFDDRRYCVLSLFTTKPI